MFLRIFTPRWLVPSLIALIGLLVVGASTSVAAPKVRGVTDVTFVPFSRSEGYPEPGSTGVGVGFITSKALEPNLPAIRGMAVRRTTGIDSPAPLTYRLTGTGKDFYRQGTMKSRFHLTATVDLVERRVSIEGGGRVVKGTGKFRGVSGRFKFISPPDPLEPTGPVTHTVRGWIRLPHWN